MNKEKKKRTHKVTDEELLEALQANAGIFARTARYIEEKYGIQYGRSAVCRRAKKFKEELEQIREANIDLAEATLLELMECFDDKTKLRAVQFYLKTQGKKRGYTEKSEVEHTGTMSVNWGLTEEDGTSDEFD